MSEVEFDLLLDVVRSAIAPVPGEDSMLATLPLFSAPRKAAAANDNQTDGKAPDNKTPWPLIPFPDGWYAAC
jgi:hypothetical protein